MPKQIYSDFSGGLSINDRNISDNQFYIGEKVDIFLDEKYIQPSPLPLDNYSSSDILRGLPIAGTMDGSANKFYIMTTNGDLYQLQVGVGWNADFDGSAHKYRAIGSFDTTYGGVGFNDMVIYNCKTGGTSGKALLYTYNTATKAYIGRYPLTGTAFNDVYNDMTTGTSYLNPHPIIEWNSYLWIGNGQYLAKFDGQTGNEGTINATALNLGVGWEITCLFTTQNYIGICAWKKGSNSYFTHSRIFFWDGTSSTFNYSVSVESNKILSATNHNGKIILSLVGRNYFNSIGILTENGFNQIVRLKLLVNNILTALNTSGFNTVAVAENKIYFGNDGRSAVFSLGDGYGDDIFAFPYLLSTTANDKVGLVKAAISGGIYVGWQTAAGVYYLYGISPADATKGTANYKAGYTDMGQRVRVNYVKFYFKPLVSGNSLQVGLDVDYINGTVTSLGTIKYNPDGAINSKIFRKSFTCHAFRPVITWVAGGTAVSKIVVDFDYISD